MLRFFTVFCFLVCVWAAHQKAATRHLHHAESGGGVGELLFVVGIGCHVVGGGGGETVCKYRGILIHGRLLYLCVWFKYTQKIGNFIQWHTAKY